MAQQYFIEDMDFTGEIIGIDCGDIGPVDPPIVDPIPLGDPFVSSCAQNEAAGFTYIKLRKRESSTSGVDEAKILGENPINHEILIPDNYYNTIIFRQIPFQAYTYAAIVSQTSSLLIQITKQKSQITGLKNYALSEK